MRNNYIYQLTATILPYENESVQHDLGVFTSFRRAEAVMRDYVKNGNFRCPVYCYTIAFLPLNDDFEYVSEQRMNLYSSDGLLQISEYNVMSCVATWSKRLNINIRAYVDIGPFQKPYFMLYNHWQRGLATKCARISFLEPKYELSASYNKSVWFLDENEKRMLVRFLKTKVKYAPQDNRKNKWQCVISAFNNEVQGENDLILPYDLPIPDYRKL